MLIFNFGAHYDEIARNFGQTRAEKHLRRDYHLLMSWSIDFRGRLVFRESAARHDVFSEYWPRNKESCLPLPDVLAIEANLTDIIPQRTLAAPFGPITQRMLTTAGFEVLGGIYEASAPLRYS